LAERYAGQAELLDKPGMGLNVRVGRSTEYSDGPVASANGRMS